METRANHIWVGAVTIALLAILAAFIVWIARLGEGSQDEYDIFFKQSVDGLSNGSAVNFSGVPVGQISQIELWKKDPSFVKVRIKVSDDTPILQGIAASIQGSFTGVSTIQLEGAARGAAPLVCPKENRRAVCPEGVPVIPTKRSGLGELLNNAPLLLERLATLTERMTVLFSDKNQQSLEGILANTERMSGELATTSPQFRATLAELQLTLRQAGSALAAYERVGNSLDVTINQEGGALARQLRQTLASADNAADELQGVLAEARPATRQLSESTIPAAEAAIRDLRATTRALRNVTEKVDDQGAGALLGAPPLPDYKP